MKKNAALIPMTWRQPLQRMTPEQRLALWERREGWLREIDPDSLFHRLFDLLPGVHFFAKKRGRGIMFLSQSLREIHRLPDAQSVIGLDDFALNPPAMAAAFADDDALIYATGKSLYNRVKLGFDPHGRPDWYVVNKMPIRSRTGEIIGVMGFSQSYEARARSLPPFHAIAKAVNCIQQQFAQEIKLEHLARISGLSTRQMQRKFKAIFGVGPQKFLIKTRLLAACRKLRETEASVAEVAFACGFSDQSAFARHFQRHMLMTPKQFRQQEASL